ncbi:hypothetical protein [Halomonas llamarensis]|uniref:Organic solvent tolerance-like N-terminal domain-containing protein n=1 Tax=Halomonas llamarensis TaxID=2945104 RepID=A0ABT0SMI5_9GAMM|nr:hypothetical protein [Halomonas llamarensis]MCL7929007.1 hypothetical protein [Halomonas llamarensis]
MSFRSSLRLTTTWFAALATPLLALPLYAAEDTLSLPDNATIGVELVDAIAFSDGESRKESILLRPSHYSDASHVLPEYCVLIGDAQMSDDRLRITAHDVTCIETDNADSAIFSGAISASAYDSDGQYGLTCDKDECVTSSGRSFSLTLSEALEVKAQDNPSAEINEKRRQANGDGVANPIPSEHSDPENQ